MGGPLMEIAMKTRVLLFAMATLTLLGSTACVIIRPKDLPDYLAMLRLVCRPPSAPQETLQAAFGAG